MTRKKKMRTSNGKKIKIKHLEHHGQRKYIWGGGVFLSKYKNLLTVRIMVRIRIRVDPYFF
jgi:hypothetical protein